MATIEVDEAAWQRAIQLDRFAQAAMADPAKRKVLLSWDEQFNPAAKHPEIHQPDPVADTLTALRDEMGKFREDFAAQKAAAEEAAAQARLRAEWDKGRQLARDDGFLPEGIAKIEELMEKRGIADWEAGIALYHKLNPPPEPVAASAASWDLFGPETQESPDFKGLIEDISNGGDGTNFLNKATEIALKEVRAAR